jgi:hypothetical protein
MLDEGTFDCLDVLVVFVLKLIFGAWHEIAIIGGGQCYVCIEIYKGGIILRETTSTEFEGACTDLIEKSLPYFLFVVDPCHPMKFCVMVRPYQGV